MKTWINIYLKHDQRRYDPARRLIAAVVVLVIRDYLHPTKSPQSSHQQSAARFIESENGLALIAALLGTSERKARETLRLLRYRAARGQIDWQAIGQRKAKM